jgi:hypothetical protein
MTVAQWVSGKTYPPGSLCVPTSSAPIVTPPIPNAGFETGDLTGWATTSGVWSVIAGGYSGSYQAVTSSAGAVLDQNVAVPAQPGQSITASMFAQMANAGTNNGDAVIGLVWLNSASMMISQTLGNHVGGKGGHWSQSSVTSVAPAGTVAVFIRIAATAPSGGQLAVDSISWNYVEQARPSGLIFKATQAAPGKSGSSEPAWPVTDGVSVTDNQVTWLGEYGSRIVWQAVALLETGDTEPDWPASVGAVVHDGTIDWVAQSQQITDPNCPPSRVVCIAASKIYAGDGDIVRYSATVNPLDWTTANDAGYLPTGLQQYGSNPVTVMNLYRSNLVVFNSEGFQMWQVDPDPSISALLDSMPIGSILPRGTTPVAGDLFFLSTAGIRSVGISATGVNLESGDVGMPIDPLVIPDRAYIIASSGHPSSTYVPALGQAWHAFPQADGTTHVYVYSINVPNAPGKWSRYIFPFLISEFCIQGDQLLIRAGDNIMLYDSTVFTDVQSLTNQTQSFQGVIQTPWLDDGNIGTTKMMVAMDVAASGGMQVQVGYDQTDLTAFTDAFEIPADTVPGMPIPLPISAPSFSLKITFDAGSPWKLSGANIYLQDSRTMT